jgi:hypothetical protein
MVCAYLGGMITRTGTLIMSPEEIRLMLEKSRIHVPGDKRINGSHDLLDSTTMPEDMAAHYRNTGAPLGSWEARVGDII